MSETQPKIKQRPYSELTVRERYLIIDKMGEPLQTCVTTLDKHKYSSAKYFFIDMHKLAMEIDKFIKYYFDGNDPEKVLENIDYLNKVNAIQIMIKAR